MGPFAHQLLARNEARPLFERCGIEFSQRNLAALLTGSIAPDAGYYPGADVRLAQSAHHDKSWDLARNLLDMAASQEQKAFALGWLSHLLADQRGHKEVVNPGVGWSGPGDNLNHQRLEWGMDCRLLAEPANEWLWNAQLDAGGAPDLWSKALARVYGLELSSSVFQNALEIETGIMAKLPWLFLCIGSSKRPGHGLLHAAGLLMGRPLSRVLARAGGRLGMATTLRAVLSPIRPQAETWRAWQSLVDLHGQDLSGVLAGAGSKADLDYGSQGITI